MDRRIDELAFSDFYIRYGGRDEQLYGTDVRCPPYAEDSIGLDNDSGHPNSRSVSEPAFGLEKGVLDCLRANLLHLDLPGCMCLHLVSQLLASFRLQVLNVRISNNH